MTGGQIPLLLAGLQELIMGNTLLKCAAADVGIQWAGWALAAAFRTEKFYDLAGESLDSRPRARVFINRGNFLRQSVRSLRFSHENRRVEHFCVSDCLLIILLAPKQSDLSFTLTKHVI